MSAAKTPAQRASKAAGTVARPTPPPVATPAAEAPPVDAAPAAEAGTTEPPAGSAPIEAPAVGDEITQTATGAEAGDAAAAAPAGGTPSAEAHGDADVIDVDGADADADDEAAVARALALANLLAGDPVAGDEVSPGGSGNDPVPSSVDLSGRTFEWGGDVPFVVTTYMHNAIVAGAHQTAYRGDVVRTTLEGAARGLELGSLAALDDNTED